MQLGLMFFSSFHFWFTHFWVFSKLLRIWFFFLWFAWKIKQQCSNVSLWFNLIVQWISLFHLNWFSSSSSFCHQLFPTKWLCSQNKNCLSAYCSLIAMSRSHIHFRFFCCCSSLLLSLHWRQCWHTTRTAARDCSSRTKQNLQ